MLYGIVNIVIWHFTGFGELYRVLPKPHPTIQEENCVNQVKFLGLVSAFVTAVI